MANNSETEVLINGPSNNTEVDGNSVGYEEGEKETEQLLMDSTGKSTDVSLEESKSNDEGKGSSPTTSPDADESKKEEDISKSVTFAEDIEVFDLSSNAATPITISLDTPVSQVDQREEDNPDKDVSNDLAAVLPVSNSQSDISLVDKTLSPPRPSDLTLPDSEQPFSTSETTAKDSDQSGHKQFEVSNVDESVLKRDNESQDRNGDGNLEDRPLLKKIPSTASDGYSGNSSLNFNHDTIGPLDNPNFLKRLNYSVSQVPEDDGGFSVHENLDLGDFQGGQPPPDMDGGWAWVVLFAAFLSLSLTGATTFAAGVLMPAILDKIDPDITKASWVGAVHVSVLCMSGPFVGIVLTRIGARWTAFCAGIVMSGGLILASFATSVFHLIITHGLIAGIGSGFILNTMFVICGQYFNRFRGLACGLLATGSGAGMLAGGSVLTALFNNFGLNGTYILWGGITLHALIFAMLLRPSPEERLRAAEKKMAMDPGYGKEMSHQDLRSERNSIISGLNSVYGSVDGQSLFSGRKFQKYPSKLSKGDVGVAPLLKTVLHKEMSRSSYSVSTTRSQKSHVKSNTNIPSSPVNIPSKFTFGPAATSDSLGVSYTSSSPGTTPQSHSVNVAQEQADPSAQNEKSNSPNQERSMSTSNFATIAIPENEPYDPSTQNPQSSPTSSRAPSFRRRLLSGSSQIPSQYTSTGRLSYRSSIREQLTRNDLDNESLASTLVSHLQPKDALTPRYQLGSRSISSMMGSIASFPTALAIIKDDLARLEGHGAEEKKTLKDFLIGFLDSLRLLRNGPFLVFITTCMLWALGDSPYTMYLPAYALEKGATSMQASSLYTGMGFGSMCGRFLSGLTASDSGIGPILLHIGCLSVASLVVGLTPFVTDTYIQQMMCAGLFGLYTGSLVPLSSLITIELLGIGELGLGFGFLSMAQGIGYLAGPPLGGMIVKALGFELSFVFAGFCLLSASLLAMIIAILLRNATFEEDDIHDSFDDLEKALRRISDTESGVGASDDEHSPQEEETSHRQPFIMGSFKRKDDHAGSGGGGGGSGDAPQREIASDGVRKEDTALESVKEETLPSVTELETITEEG